MLNRHELRYQLTSDDENCIIDLIINSVCVIQLSRHILHFSIAGVNAMKGSLDYGCTKAALDMVTKQFALELGPHNIRVNSVNPTGVWTEPMKRLMKEYPDYYERFISITPMGRFCELQEVVDPILYLLSDHSSMVTGTTHIVDGGLLASIPV